jgi:hypothetical protein
MIVLNDQLVQITIGTIVGIETINPIRIVKLTISELGLSGSLVHSWVLDQPLTVMFQRFSIYLGVRIHMPVFRAWPILLIHLHVFASHPIAHKSVAVEFHSQSCNCHSSTERLGKCPVACEANMRKIFERTRLCICF